MFKAFPTRRQIAAAWMLSDANLTAIDAANLRFIVGSWQTKVPKDLAKQFHYHPGPDLANGTTVDTFTNRAWPKTSSTPLTGPLGISTTPQRTIQ